MEQLAPQVALIAIAYALGCVSTGYYFVRARSGTDIREAGSGNYGARNVGRIHGRSAFAVTLAGDTLKATIPVALAQYFGFETVTIILVSLAVVIGHIWPVQLRFRGGKGLASAMGAVLAIDYRVVLIALVVAAAVWLISRHMTASGLLAVLIAPLLALLLGNTLIYMTGIAVLTMIIMATHRENIRTMFAGVTGQQD